MIRSCTGQLLRGVACLVQGWYKDTVDNIYAYYEDMATYFWNNQFQKDVASAINGEHYRKPHSMQQRTCNANLFPELTSVYKVWRNFKNMYGQITEFR